MYKAIIIATNISQPEPTAKEIKEYLKGSGKLLYGNDKRTSNSFELKPDIHLVMSSYGTFEKFITKKDNKWGSFKSLYVFDDKVNSTHLFLKYGGIISHHFNLDKSIIDEMHECAWRHSNLTRYERGLYSELRDFDFLIENNIGTKKLHSKRTKLANCIEDINVQNLQSIKLIEDRAKALFTSGW